MGGEKESEDSYNQLLETSSDYSLHLFVQFCMCSALLGEYMFLQVSLLSISNNEVQAHGALSTQIYDQGIKRLKQAKTLLIRQQKSKCNSREHSSSIIDATEERPVSAKIIYILHS